MRKVTFRSVAIAGLLLASSAAVAPPAAAEDYVFTVPVDVRGISAGFTEGVVECVVVPSVPSPPPASVPGVMLGSGIARFALTNGAYHGTVVVKFNANAGQLQNGKGYYCMLALYSGTGGYDRPASSEPHLPGTPFNVDIRGALYAQPKLTLP